jgi:hypothetical protein
VDEKKRYDPLDRAGALLTLAIKAGVADDREWRARSKRFDRIMDELRAAQRETQASLKAFIDSMNRGGNGRH